MRRQSMFENSRLDLSCNIAYFSLTEQINSSNLHCQEEKWQFTNSLSLIREWKSRVNMQHLMFR
jgi:hypothetical protein